jgi:hypothetical protein
MWRARMGDRLLPHLVEKFVEHCARDDTRDTLERTFVRPAVEYLGERFAWTLRAFQALTVLVALQTLLLLWLLFRTRPGPAP